MLFGIEYSRGVALSQSWFTTPNRMHTENLLMFPRHIPSETILEKLLHATTTQKENGKVKLRLLIRIILQDLYHIIILIYFYFDSCNKGIKKKLNDNHT